MENVEVKHLKLIRFYFIESCVDIFLLGDQISESKNNLSAVILSSFCFNARLKESTTHSNLSIILSEWDFCVAYAFDSVSSWILLNDDDENRRKCEASFIHRIEHDHGALIVIRTVVMCVESIFRREMSRRIFRYRFVIFLYTCWESIKPSKQTRVSTQ